MVKKFVENPDRKSTKQRSKRVKEVACQEPKPLQAKNSVKEAGEKMRSLDTNRLPVASGDHLVGAVEGNYPERKVAGFGHDPQTALVRGIMVKKAYYSSKISRWMRHGKLCASIISIICPLWTKICASWVLWH
jgi:predicted transcriptional regulator